MPAALSSIHTAAPIKLLVGAHSRLARLWQSVCEYTREPAACLYDTDFEADCVESEKEGLAAGC